MDLEEKYAIALGVLSILLLLGGTILGKALAGAPPRVIRTVLPVVALFTFAAYAAFVAVARHVVKG